MLSFFVLVFTVGIIDGFWSFFLLRLRGVLKFVFVLYFRWFLLMGLSWDLRGYLFVFSLD